MDKASKAHSFRKPLNESSNIKKVIAVMSGKGGVGKSSITSLIAVSLKDEGYKVGILDGDITGPSIMKIFGIEGQRAEATEKGAVPAVSKNGIKIMSIQALMQKSEEAAIWRGPMISSVVQQFWTDVVWGELDFLLIDMPPGTADVPLTVMQSIPLDGVVIVTSPQELVELVVKKSINMAKTMKIPIIGIIENLSYIVCSHCSNKIKLFGESRVDKTSQDTGVDVLGKLPMDIDFIKFADSGQIENYEGELKSIFRSFLNKLTH